MKSVLFLFLVSICVMNAFAQIDSTKVKWISFEEAKEKFSKVPKNILIFFHSANDPFSKAMIDTTFKNKEVCDYINVAYYPVQMDIFSKDKIKYLNDTIYSPSEKSDEVHNLVKMLLGAQPAMPAMVIMNKEGQGSVFNDYFDRDGIFSILVYFYEEHYQFQTFDVFKSYYEKTYPPKNKKGFTVTRSLVKWKTLKEAFDASKIVPKKIFIDIYSNYNIGSTMMYISVLNNPVIAKILNENFYPVHLDAFSKDTIEAMGIKYINEGQAHGFHQLPIAMLEGKMKFPAMLILNEENKVLNKFQQLFTAEEIEAILAYIHSNKYLTDSFVDFKKNFVSAIPKESDTEKK